MYLLPNRKHIDIDGVVLGLLSDDPLSVFFLDSKECVVISCVVDKKTEYLKNIQTQKDRYFEIPQVSRLDKERWMKEFLEDFVSFEDTALSEKLLSKTPDILYENALNEITKSEDGWIHAWVQWSHDSAFGALEDWLVMLPIEITNEWEGCDDCAMCKAMKEGKDSSPEIMKAFSEQNFMNNVEEIIRRNNISS
jgi:hypothetical protein